MFGRLNGRSGRRNGQVPVEPPRVPPILTVTSPPGGAGRTVAEAVAGCLEMRLLDVDAGIEQLAGPIKETLAYLWDSPDLLQALLGSLSGDATAARPVRDVLFDLASRSGMVVFGSGAGAMLSHRPDAFHVRVEGACTGGPQDTAAPAYELVLDLELLPVDTCVDLIVAASRSHARRAAAPAPLRSQPAPPAWRRTPAHQSPDVVLERLARALQSEIGRQG